MGSSTLKFIASKGLLCNRVGSPNAQKQKHRQGNVAPVTRGIWAFPWPLNDYFFSSHQAKKFYNKEELEAGYSERIKCKTHLKTKQIWWDRPFYSHLKPDEKMSDEYAWYLWEDMRLFLKVAERSRFRYEYYAGKLYRGKYSIDHLELFLPMTGQNLPKFA